MKYLRTLKEVFVSSLPLMLIIVVVCFFIEPITNEEMIRLFIGYLLVVVGQTIFLVGLDDSVLPMGKLVGGSLNKLKKIIFIVLFGVLFGFLATVAEPDLSVLSNQLASINPNINSTLFVWIVGFGLGIFVGFSLYRVIKNISIKYCYIILCVIIFVVAFFVPNQFVALAFDAGGATTGAVSVPFILALGLGISTTLSRSKTNEESFGIIGLASLGPILVIFIYGLIAGNSSSLNVYTAGATEGFLSVWVGNLGNIALAFLPIIVIFFIFQFFFIKLPKRHLLKMLVSSLIVFVGLLLFLTGVDYGFAFAGKHIGETFTSATRPEWFKFLLLPIGFILGVAIIYCEPAVQVLGEQVEEITNGHIKKKVLKRTLAIGIGFAAFFAMLRTLFEINILYFFLPIYAIALILMIFCPKIFTALAFDSGGVASGTITSAFLTPLALGASQALGQDLLVLGFGIVGFISAVPLIAIQILGVIYNVKLKQIKKSGSQTIIDELKSITKKRRTPKEWKKDLRKSIRQNAKSMQNARNTSTVKDNEEKKINKNIKISDMDSENNTQDNKNHEKIKKENDVSNIKKVEEQESLTEKKDQNIT